MPVPQLHRRPRRLGAAVRRQPRPRRVDRLNAIIDAIAADRADVDVLPLGDWIAGQIDDATIRPDGSHFEYRGHNPAADAFIEH